MSLSPVASALNLVSRGFCVVPCHYRLPDGACSCGRGNCGGSTAKHPIHGAWQAHLCRTEEDVEREWGVDHLRNVGIALGRESGVIDFENDTDGSDQVFRLIFGEAYTPTFRSARGLHRLFRWRPGLEDLAAGYYGEIEVRGGSPTAGAQSIGPGSTHHTGLKIEWLPGLSPDDVPLADISDRELTMLRRVFKKSSADALKILDDDSDEIGDAFAAEIDRLQIDRADDEIQLPGKDPFWRQAARTGRIFESGPGRLAGGRDNALYKFASSMVAMGLKAGYSEETDEGVEFAALVLEMTALYDVTRCVPPLGPEQVVKKVASAAKHIKLQPRVMVAAGGEQPPFGPDDGPVAEGADDDENWRRSLGIQDRGDSYDCDWQLTREATDPPQWVLTTSWGEMRFDAEKLDSGAVYRKALLHGVCLERWPGEWPDIWRGFITRKRDVRKTGLEFALVTRSQQHTPMPELQNRGRFANAIAFLRRGAPTFDSKDTAKIPRRGVRHRDEDGTLWLDWETITQQCDGIPMTAIPGFVTQCGGERREIVLGDATDGELRSLYVFNRNALKSLESWRTCRNDKDDGD